MIRQNGDPNSNGSWGWGGRTTDQVVLKETGTVKRRSQEDRTEGKDKNTCRDDKEQTRGSTLGLGYSGPHYFLQQHPEMPRTPLGQGSGPTFKRPFLKLFCSQCIFIGGGGGRREGRLPLQVQPHVKLHHICATDQCLQGSYPWG